MWLTSRAAHGCLDTDLCGTERMADVRLSWRLSGKDKMLLGPVTTFRNFEYFKCYGADEI